MEEKQRELARLERLLKQKASTEQERIAAQNNAKRDRQREKRLAKRYHKVKFFERIKLVRKLKQLKSQLLQLSQEGAEAIPEDTKNRETIEEEYSTLEGDLKYVLFFPKGEKYISIVKSNVEPSHLDR